MFIGHFGTAFAARKIDKNVSLGTTFLAAQFIDLLWPLFVLLGIEKVTIEPGNTTFTPLNFYYYPFSHSMVSSLFWALVFGFIYYLIKKNNKGAILVGALVFGHWILDLLSHGPDLQIAPGLNYKLGLGLWNSVPATLIVEGSIYIVGAYFFLKEFKNRPKSKQIALWCLIILLSLLYVANLVGPPPPSVNAIAYSGLGMWLFIAWAYWVDSK